MTMIDKISALRGEASEAGDLVQVHLCNVALCDCEPVTTAVEFEEAFGGAGLSNEDRSQILRIESQQQAWDECRRVIDQSAAQRD